MLFKPSFHFISSHLQRGGAAGYHTGGGSGGPHTMTSNKPLGGTVFASRSFNVDADVEKIHDAMKGWGTDEQPLIDVLAYRSNEQRQQVRAKYPKKHKKVSVA